MKSRTKSKAKSKFNIFLGPAGTPGFTRGGTLEGIKDVAELNLSALEIQFTYGVRMSVALAKECGKAAKENNIHLSCHAPYYVNLCNPKKLKVSMKRIMSAAERMGAAGGGVVTFHPGFYGKLEKQEAFDRIISACKELVKRTPRSVKLGLETTGKSGAFGTLDEIVAVCKKVRRCIPVIDFAHIYARQVGKIDYGKVLDAVKPLRLKHLHTHFSNVEYTAKGERRHLVLDDSPPFEPLAKEIMRRKQNITIICESPILELDSLRMKKVFESLGHEF
ncbi:MAG: TIM barrel protein [Candidatus Syntrophoarchaeum sp.]|nr:TIM barrel protein [Candidatus Syntrophoarchaeum sp.]